MDERIRDLAAGADERRTASPGVPDDLGELRRRASYPDLINPLKGPKSEAVRTWPDDSGHSDTARKETM